MEQPSAQFPAHLRLDKNIEEKKSKTSYLESLNHYATSRVYPQILCFKQENDILVSRFRPSADIQKDLLFAARVNG